MIATRFCPRCKQVTDWTNESTGTFTVACTGVDEDGNVCGLTTGEQLSDEEVARLREYDAKPVIPPRRRYVRL